MAVDAPTHQFSIDPWDVVRFGYRYPGAPGSGQLPEVARLADPLAESPMGTRIRLAIHVDGLPVPVLQHPVGAYDLDMAYPDVLLAVEYDGREHLTPERARRDLERQAHLTAAGWTVLRFRAADVLHRPWMVAAAVRRALAARGVIAADRVSAPRQRALTRIVPGCGDDRFRSHLSAPWRAVRCGRHRSLRRAGGPWVRWGGGGRCGR